MAILIKQPPFISAAVMGLGRAQKKFIALFSITALLFTHLFAPYANCRGLSLPNRADPLLTAYVRSLKNNPFVEQISEALDHGFIFSEPYQKGENYYLSMTYHGKKNKIIFEFVYVPKK